MRNYRFGRNTELGDYYRRGRGPGREEAVKALRTRLCEWRSCGSTNGVAPVHTPRVVSLAIEAPWLCGECRQRLAAITVTSSMNSDGETEANVEVSG